MSIRSTKSVIYSELFLREVIAAFKTVPVAALATPLKCRLIKDPGLAPTPATLLAVLDVAQADYTDYAEASVVLIEPANVGADLEGAIATVTFSMTTDPPVTTNTIHGYYLVSGATVVMSEMFGVGQGVAMASAGDYLTLNLALPLPGYVVMVV